MAVLLALLPAAASAQAFKWWNSEKFQRELQLTEDQITRIEGIFQAALPDFRQQKRTLDRLEDELSHLIDTSGDEAHVMQHADKVEEVRADLSKARTRMLVRIRQVLTPEQRLRLTQLHQQWERDRDRRRQDRRQ